MGRNTEENQNKKILVVEDESSYLKILKDQLVTNGFDVIEAIDGSKGLSLAKLEHPDLIILDVRMPGMTGLAMLDELRKDAYGKHVKVIVLTNIEPDDSMLRQVLQDLPTYYLMKIDTKLGELIEKIQTLFLEDKKYAMIKA